MRLPLGQRVKVLQTCGDEVNDAEEAERLDRRYLGRKGRIVGYVDDGQVDDTPGDPMHEVAFGRGIPHWHFWTEELQPLPTPKKEITHMTPPNNTGPMKYTMTQNSIVVVFGGKTHTVRSDSPNFIPLKTAIFNERWEDVGLHLDIGKSLSSWAKGKFTVTADKKLTYNGKTLPDSLIKRIMAMAARTNGDPTPFFKFWERLQKNPSFRSVEQLWPFLEEGTIPLTLDGCFLAYKSVRSDYMDHHSGTIKNVLGTTISMPRNEISDDPEQACHVGLHVGAWGYASTFCTGGGNYKLLICKVDPENVVCVPHDHNAQKMRVSAYEILGHSTGQPLKEWIYDEDDFSETPKPKVAKAKPAKKKDAGVGFSPHDPPAPSFVSAKKKYAPENWPNLSLAELRVYANKMLKIVGAGHIHGGKAALLDLMLKQVEENAPEEE